MRRGVLTAIVVVLLLATARARAEEPAGDNPFAKIPWTAGPAVGALGDVAEVKVPERCLFAGAEGTKKFLELTQNIPSGHELGMLLPMGEQGAEGWFVLFTYESTGHVKDDEKDSIDADALLKSLKEGQDDANADRKKRGWEPLYLKGWAKPPFYDPKTNNLTWATTIATKDSQSVNWSTRLLGRDGTMNVDLVLGPDQMDTVVPAFDTMMTGFTYKSGHTYAEFRKGDKVAAYGLTALIAGGAAAAAFKTGLLAKFWKVIVGVIAAGAAGLKSLWTRFRRSNENEVPTSQG